MATQHHYEQKEYQHAVLLVEDHPDIREAYAAPLLSEQFAVVLARDGEEALAELHRGLRPCVILLDLAMPNMDGWAFRRAQISNAGFADIPVVAVTAYSLTPERAPAGIDVLTKPVDPDRLLAYVNRYCEHAAAHPPA